MQREMRVTEVERKELEGEARRWKASQTDQGLVETPFHLYGDRGPGLAPSGSGFDVTSDGILG